MTYNVDFYLSQNILKDVMITLNERHTNIIYILNNNYFDNSGKNIYLDIEVSDKVSKGEVYIRDTLNMYCDNFDCKNNTFSINVDNLYYKDTLNLKISEIYNSENSKKLLNIDYEASNDTIYMNENDYNYLFNKGNYQSSIFVNEIKNLNDVTNKLNDIGYDTLKLREAKYDDTEMVKQILNIFKLIVTTVLIITLFFISYFIIRIIYKSRNSYYTTLRTLGSTKKVCINILMKELISHATIAYITFLILILLSILMSYRYGRKIFKDSIIKTYGERL